MNQKTLESALLAARVSRGRFTNSGGTVTTEALDAMIRLMPKPIPPLLMPGGKLTRREADQLMREGCVDSITS